MASINSFIRHFHVIRQIPIFKKLRWFEVRNIVKKSIIVEYKKGDIIRRQGDPPDFFYCLVSGRLQSYTLNNKSVKDHIQFIHRGMYFGIVSLLTGEVHSQNYEAINDSVVLQIPKNDFHSLLNATPKLAIEFSQHLSKSVRTKVVGAKTHFENKIISVYSPLKGTGSSTYAVNLALGLGKETGKKVVFVNIHSKNATVASAPSANVSVDLKDIVKDHEKINQSIIKGKLKIDLLSVVFDPGDSLLRRQISHFVSTLVGDYHYVVVDLPNDMDDLVFETLTQSDLVHLVTLDQGEDLKAIRSVIDRLVENLKGSFREEKIRVIIRSLENKVYLAYDDVNSAIDYNVYTVLPTIEPADLKENISFNGFSILICDPKSGYVKAVTRIARQIGEVMIGVVLGGGAALGVAHVGVIKVLEEENIPVDVIVGSSMGALIGSLWAVGKNYKELELVAREFEKKKDMLKLFDPVLPISGLIAGNAITRWLRGHLEGKTFYDTVIPLKVVAYDLIRRQEIIIDRGPLAEAVRESIAIPGVIEPVLHNDQMIIDGGVLNPLPTNVLVNMGIKKIIAVNVLQSPEDTAAGQDLLIIRQKEEELKALLKSPIHFFFYKCKRGLGKLFRVNISDIIVRTLQASEYVIAQQSAQQADVLLHPDLVGINWYELYQVDALINSGEKAARENLLAIKALVAQKE